MQRKLKTFLQSLGPGILFASTCIGVSHLVQSTRAGALYGFGLLWAVIAANLFKYPFFEYGSRYANITGTSIIDGYQKTGKWMLWLYFLITLCSMFFVAAAVGAVTASFMDNLFGITATFGQGSAYVPILILFLACILILIIGNYKALDSLIKIVGSILLISTVIAIVLTLFRGPVIANHNFFSPEVFNWGSADFAFLIALMGWMPTALDLSAWNSLWTLERIKQTNYHPTLRETLREFKFGYLVSAVLAPCFLLLGAYLLYGTDYEMPENSAAFSNAIINLYTETIGKWSYILIAASAFSIMFGTIIAVFDGYSRSTERILELIIHYNPQERQAENLNSNSIYYKISLLAIGIGGLLIVFQFGSSLKTLIDLATTISFVIAPVIAIVNFYLVSGKDIPDHGKPSTMMKILSYAGILFLTVFSVIYVFWLF